MSEPTIALEVHRDSANDRESRRTLMTVHGSCLPGFVVLSFEEPRRLIVLRKEHLLAAIEAV